MSEKEEIKYHFCAECEKILCDNCMEEKPCKSRICKCGQKCCKDNGCEHCRSKKNC